jgi:hypothetical protein
MGLVFKNRVPFRTFRVRPTENAPRKRSSKTPSFRFFSRPLVSFAPFVLIVLFVPFGPFVPFVPVAAGKAFAPGAGGFSPAIPFWRGIVLFPPAETIPAVSDPPPGLPISRAAKAATGKTE